MDPARLRTIEELEALAGPVGPLGTLEWFDEHQAQLAAGAPQWLLDGLIDVLTNRPATAEDWCRIEFVASELLTAMGRQRDLIDRLRPLLDVPSARPAIIDVFGGLADPRTVSDLVRLHANGGLPTDDLLRLVDALGAIGDTEATACLHRIRATTDVPEVSREVDIVTWAGR